ncbi:unnamed protein product [Hermetia illucens]|uniref:Uncharacterized protein n=1 Tax=Hermetia illucens TaxID=343691 RepID=A0A7R8UNE9_HERIL|nr:unnamed protein product [Hermetia illucens]
MSNSNSVLYVINVQYCDLVSQPTVENMLPNTWSPQEAEFHDVNVGLEIAKRSPFKLLIPSYWLMRSKDLKNFKFESGCYDNLLIIIGKSEIYWHAMNRSDNEGSNCLSGTTAAETCLRSDQDAVKQIEGILRLIHHLK